MMSHRDLYIMLQLCRSVAARWDCGPKEGYATFVILLFDPSRLVPSFLSLPQLDGEEILFKQTRNRLSVSGLPCRELGTCAGQPFARDLWVCSEVAEEASQMSGAVRGLLHSPCRPATVQRWNGRKGKQRPATARSTNAEKRWGKTAARGFHRLGARASNKIDAQLSG